MSIEKAKAYLRQFGAEDRVIRFPVSRDRRAAPEAILRTGTHRKTLSFRTNDGVILVAAGDTKIDNPKYKARIRLLQARMLAFEEVEPEIGHAVGGVCPFGVNDGVTVYLDESLDSGSETVFPGVRSSTQPSGHHPRTGEILGFKAWVDICKGWRGREHGCYRAVQRRGGQKCQSREIERLAQTTAENGAKMLFLPEYSMYYCKSERTVEKYRGRRTV